VYRLVPMLVALFLAGCAGHSPEAQTPPGLAAQDDAKCQSYGLQPGTPEYDKCRAKLADQRTQAEFNDRAALAGRLQGRLPM
jgi:hypothetical protein